MTTRTNRERPAPSGHAIVEAVARAIGLMLAVAAVLISTGVLTLVAQVKPPAWKPPVQPSTTVPAATDTTILERRVIAYYFHTNYRCATCRKLEAYSHAAIEAAFPEELESGRLVWRLVNLEEKGNEHFIKAYQLYTKALVVVEEAKGQQKRWKNLEEIWELVTQKEKFYAYVQNEVRIYLNETP